MRVIKFRAWDVFNADMFPAKHNDDLLVAFFRDVNERRIGGNTVHVMQYTGLTDKNGTEIYEGDILSVIKLDRYPRRPTVIWWRDKWTLQNQSGTKKFQIDSILFDEDDMLRLDEIEVIGNIHENPELMES